MKDCKPLQEKLVAGQKLSAEEENHFATCPACRQLAQTHAWLLSEAACCRDCHLPAEAPPRTVRRARRSGSRLAWALAFSGAAALALAVFLRPAADTTRVAQRLGALLEDVYRTTDVTSEETPDELTGAGWLWGKEDDPTLDLEGWL